MNDAEDPKNYVVGRPGRFFFVGWAVAAAAAVAATAGLVLAHGVWIERQTALLSQQAARGRHVLVRPVLVAPKSRAIEIPASVHGYVETPVYAKVSGYLKRIFVDKGDRVRSGQKIAILESPEIDQQVADAKANYGIAALTDSRNQKLRRAGVVAQQVADDSHAAMLQAKATYQRMLAMQAYEVIRAPFDAVVTARYVDPGALIPQVTTPAAASAPVVSLATLSPLRVYAYVPQSAAPFVRDGDPAVITVNEYPRREFVGHVTRHPKALDAATRTMLVEVDLPNSDRALYPGMYALAKFRIPMRPGVPLVPDDALVFRADKVFVPVVRENRLHLVEVRLGYDNGSAVEITKGVTEHDMVAIDVGQAARDGEPVRPVVLKGPR